MPLSNGTKNLTVTVVDRAGRATAKINYSFIVDNIPPVFSYYNVTPFNLSIRTLFKSIRFSSTGWGI